MHQRRKCSVSQWRKTVQTDICGRKGKIAELACGYGGSIGAIKAMGGTELKLSDDDLFKLVDDWRSSSPNIVKFWGDVQRAAEKVITDHCSMTCGKLRFSYESGIFFIELPFQTPACLRKTKG